jgi:hypothetical protein
MRQPQSAESAMPPGRATKFGLYLLTYTYSCPQIRNVHTIQHAPNSNDDQEREQVV